ncbi:PBP1 and LysM peptidoglycan-binding domain-containing protein [Winogradskyella alexanderae]|uniref:LysM peptidoglycan-binding domain-containing protein n=1 Tax=Winogradskyella alexanderae TaxID=2877123 RepID=A0ABS7XPT3_9FLAO|nr:LysM peptidoglycan-binding domain-containing protein [Winogradskyella alexanderae]MCA0132027.1 LysM peptidoglycan-binding domain-containing protein [Winogradskyella alexanderae]
MKKILSLLLFVFTISLFGQNYKTHKVLKGETIESIAKQYLVTPFDIYALNPDIKSRLKPDTIIIIPDSKVKNEPQKEESRDLIGYKSHKVKRKETLYSISKKYNVSIEEIKKANRFLYSENLKKGDKLRIPKFKTVIYKKTFRNTVKKYVVQPKEGKWRIAYKFGITVDELEALNPNMKDVLQPGDELNVPNIANNEEKVIEEAFNYYEVLPQEGFYRLKIKTGLTQEELEELNPGLKEMGLKAGMVLKLPAKLNAEAELTEVETTALYSRLSNFKTKKIALMLPYRLNRVDTDSVSETKEMIKNSRLMSVVLDFHAGVLIAMDSAKQLGISTDLKVLDTQYQISKTRELLEENSFEDYDAVIGPMNADCFDRVATTLRRDGVPVIAAMTKPKEIYSNVFQTIPDDKLLQQAMIDFIKADSLKRQVVIISDLSKSTRSEMLKSEFPTAKLIYSRKNSKTGKDGFYINPTDLENVFPKGRSIVFLETESNALASSVISLLNGLNNENEQIVLVTLDKNSAFEGKNIDNYHLSNLNFHYPSVNKNFEDQSNSYFVKTYRKLYGVSPSKYASRGFDVTLDLLLRLASGKDLYEASADDIETEYIENKFRYKKAMFSGYVNEALYIVRYQDLRIVEVD